VEKCSFSFEGLKSQIDIFFLSEAGKVVFRTLSPLELIASQNFIVPEKINLEFYQ